MLIAETLVVTGGSGGLIHSLLVLIIVGIVLGLIYYLVTIAPFIPGVFKNVLCWVIVFFGVLVLINVLLGIVGHPLIQM